MLTEQENAARHRAAQQARLTKAEARRAAKRACIPVNVLTKYVRAKLGRAIKSGEKLHVAVVAALKADGLPLPSGMSARAWGRMNRDRIQAVASGVKKAPHAYVASREAVRPATYRGDVTGDTFLQSYEWRRVRMQALKKHGARCQCCGASPATGAVMNVDHIKPRRIYPELALDITNLQVLCGECNHGKGNWDMTDWREKECASDGANAEADARFQYVTGQAARP